MIKASKRSLSLRRPVFGVGINDADYIVEPRIGGVQQKCSFYTKWNGMLKRCYSEKFQMKHPTYRGCTVSSEWLYFTKFKSWMQQMDWEGMQLDKDILFEGNKLYSKETCAFVNASTNTLINHKSGNPYDLGVCWHRKKKKFRADIKVRGKGIHIGYFDDHKDASNAWRAAKAERIINAANGENDYRVREALKLRAENLLRGG